MTVIGALDGHELATGRMQVHRRLRAESLRTTKPIARAAPPPYDLVGSLKRE
jgi:hypothetical protein